MNARYQEPEQGRFISQDPVHLGIGANRELNAFLNNPQRLNSYSYAGNNPINNTDPTGEYWWPGFYDNTGYEGVEGANMKFGEVYGGWHRGTAAIRDNAQYIEESSTRYGVDRALVEAIIYEEQSHLDDELVGPEKITYPVREGGLGVMQVSGSTGSKYGYSKKELAWDNRKNIDAGVRHLSDIQKNLKAQNVPATAANIASVYNGGGAHGDRYGARVQAQVNNSNYRTPLSRYLQRYGASATSKVLNTLKSLKSKK